MFTEHPFWTPMQSNMSNSSLLNIYLYMWGKSLPNLAVNIYFQETSLLNTLRKKCLHCFFSEKANVLTLASAQLFESFVVFLEFVTIDWVFWGGKWPCGWKKGQLYRCNLSLQDRWILLRLRRSSERLRRSAATNRISSLGKPLAGPHRFFFTRFHFVILLVFWNDFQKVLVRVLLVNLKFKKYSFSIYSFFVIFEKSSIWRYSFL